ncbi:MAG: hypothetical protein U0T82_07140 [Bacteroidales bacterium]
MKKYILFIALVLAFVIDANCQTYVQSDVAGETIDSVTVGSRMPYKVDPDPVIAALSYMNPSIFKWVFSNGITVNKEDGTGSTSVSGEPGYIVENAISSVMPNIPGTITLTVNEKSQPNSGTGCEGGDQVLDILVLPRPTINFSGVQSAGSCSVGTYNLPVVLTGYGPWTIEYSVAFNGGTAVNYTITGGNAYSCGTASNAAGLSPTAAFSLVIPAAQLASGPGEYEVKVLNVFDRIALKSLDRGLVGSVASDLPASNSYKLYIYPTPTTNPIQHVRNL